MNVKLICLMILVTSCADLALAEQPSMHVGELPKKGLYVFKVDEVPNNLTLYWDYENNRMVDDIFVCPMVAYGKMDCSKIKYADEDTYLFTTCPSSDPVYYITTRQCWVCNSCLMWLIPNKVVHPRAVTKSNVEECDFWETRDWKMGY